MRIDYLLSCNPLGIDFELGCAERENRFSMLLYSPKNQFYVFVGGLKSVSCLWGLEVKIDFQVFFVCI